MLNTEKKITITSVSISPHTSVWTSDSFHSYQICFLCPLTHRSAKSLRTDTVLGMIDPIHNNKIKV
jgi:hypothetical protein